MRVTDHHVGALAEQAWGLSDFLEAVPPEHRGIDFDRTFEEFAPHESTRRLERSLALLWAKRNHEHYDQVLVRLLHSATITGRDPDPRQAYVPKTEREWKVACLVAATLMQWLGTPVGISLVKQAYRDAGGRLEVTLPNTDDYEPPRR